MPTKQKPTTRRTFIKIGSGVATVGLAGCSGQTSNEQTPTSEPNTGGTAEEGEIMTQLAEEARNEDGPFRFYTSIPTAPADKMVNQFMDKFDLEGGGIYRAGTFDVLSKYSQEAQAGAKTADVVSVADHSSFLQLREQGNLMEYECSQFKYYPENLTDSSYFAPARALVMTPIWNADVINGDEVPDSWAGTMEMSADSWKNQFAIGDPRNSGGSMSMVFQLVNTYGDEAWEWMRNWGEAGAKVYGSHGSMASDMTSEQTPLSLENYLYQANGLTIDGANVGYKIMGGEAGGAGIASSPIAITEQTTRPATAKLFMEWALSEEGVRTIQNGFKGYTPREPNPVQWENIPTEYREINTLDFDFEKQAEQSEEIIQKWEEVVQP